MAANNFVQVSDSVSRLAFKASFVTFVVIALFSLLETTLGSTYITTVFALILLGGFSYTHMENKDSVEMYLMAMLASIILDIVVLSVYGDHLFKSYASSKMKFSGAMTIINLVFKLAYAAAAFLEWSRRGGELDLSIMSSSNTTTPEMKSAPVARADTTAAPAYEEPVAAKQATSAENMA